MDDGTQAFGARPYVTVSCLIVYLRVSACACVLLGFLVLQRELEDVL